MWIGLSEAYSSMGNWLAWKVGNGCELRLGVDPFIGADEAYKLLDDTVWALKNRGYSF